MKLIQDENFIWFLTRLCTQIKGRAVKVLELSRWKYMSAIALMEETECVLFCNFSKQCVFDETEKGGKKSQKYCG